MAVAMLGGVAVAGAMVVRSADYSHESETAPLFYFWATGIVVVLAGACTYAIDPARPKAWPGSLLAGVVTGALFAAVMSLVITFAFNS